MDFMEGNCFNFSVALHRLYGFPIALLYGHRSGTDKWGEEIDDHICIHTLALYRNSGIDFEGFKGDPYEVLTSYELINEPYDETDIFTYDSEEPFWDFVRTCGGQKSEAAIAKATEIILNDPKFSKLKVK